MDFLEAIAARSRGRGYRIVFPEGCDARIIEAAIILQHDGSARPILLGAKKEIVDAAIAAGLDAGTLESEDPSCSPLLEEIAGFYVSKRRGISHGAALRMVRRNLIFAGALVASGKADAMIAGAASTTADVISAAALTIGYRKGISTPSSFFIMMLPDGRVFFYADCAVNVNPDAGQLADIAISTADSYRRLTGNQPKVALLSFSTRGSAQHPAALKVAEAVQIVKKRNPDLMVDGEFQVDTALVPQVATRKLKDPGPVAGNADVLIFPNLDAGNIAYKLTQYLAGARAIGPILQGFARPVSDLSRGASTEDIVQVARILCSQI